MEYGGSFCVGGESDVARDFQALVVFRHWVSRFDGRRPGYSLVHYSRRYYSILRALVGGNGSSGAWRCCRTVVLLAGSKPAARELDIDPGAA